MTYDNFLIFLNSFKEIKSFTGRLKAATENLTRIGSGSGRIVFDIDGEKVLKLAKNTKGVAQNETEINSGTYQDVQHIVTKVFEYGDDNTWLIAEKAKKVNEKRIKELTNIPSLNDLYYFLRNYELQSKGKNVIFGQDRDIEEMFYENEFAQDLSDFIANYNQSSGDMGRPSTYGEVLRNGQPIIVLTDYGMNDEVYNSHYSSKNEQYRIYEMYNFADGNDDILSNIGDTGEIRHNMWALIPQGVGDGNESMNEEFISYVNERQNYPKVLISNMPFLLDCFHECVNNLKETLNIVKDKKKFYNNLLNLQEYLISQGAYNRDKLEKEESINEIDASDVPPVKGMSLDDKEYATKLVSATTVKLGIQISTPLGGGSNGFAFLTTDGNVFKISSDVSEADAAIKLMRVQPKTIAAVYALYKIFDTEKNLSYIGIIEENIENKPEALFIKYGREIELIHPNQLTIVDFYIKMKKNFNYDELVQLAQGLLTDNIEANISEENRKLLYAYMIGLFNIKRELLSYDIKSNDYSNPKNLGYKNNVLMFYDFGGYRSAEPNFGDNNMIYLPESDVELNEVDSQTGFNRKIGDIIANKVANIRGFNSPNYIGEGEHGYAYDIGDNKIMKVTSDETESIEALKIKNKTLKYLANIYGVFEINPKAGSEVPQSYVIICEKLRVDRPYFDAMVKRLDYVFKKILGLDFYNILDEYLYGEYGEIKNKIDRYLVKNSEDAKFYYGLLAIADEARQHGVKSIEYYNISNLGYKMDGSLGFFDMGWGDDVQNRHNKPEKIEVDEDGSSKFSQTDSIGSDDFPIYDQNDTSPLADNNVPTTIDQIVERILSSMKGSSTVNVKKKCKLAGLGNTSVACNQGDINNLDIKQLDEQTYKVYHGTNQKFDKFSTKLATQGIIWFTDNIDSIKNGEHGGAGNKIIMTRYITINNPAGWVEYEKYGLQQLEDMGYDGVILPQGDKTDYFLFNNKTIKKKDSHKLSEEFNKISPIWLKQHWDVLNSKHKKNSIVKNWYLKAINGNISEKEWLHLSYLLKNGNTMYGNGKLPNNFESVINETQLMSLQDLPFKQEVEELGGKIFSVGGAVRDEFLGKESKDLDILISGIPMDKLEEILSRYGRVDAVGKSFGVLKFKPSGATEDIDIAIPRTEKPTGVGGHQGFDITSDHELPIEKDLERRDFTINAIAKDVDGNIYDPYNGQEDLKNKIIRIVNPVAFSDDPLRMLRAIQFSSRFGFEIEPNTMQMIKDNAHRIKEIPPERILTEFDKIVKKGNQLIGVQLLASTGLFKQIFGNEMKLSQINSRNFTSVKTMAEFLFLMMNGVVQDPAEFYLSRFATENAKKDKIYKELQALSEAFNSDLVDPQMSIVKARSIAHNMYKIAPQTLESQILPETIQNAGQELLQGKYPKSVNDLAVNGNDLLQKGLQGKAVGDMQKSMLIRIFADKVRNTREDLLSLVNNKSEVQEGYFDINTPVQTWNVGGKEFDINFFVDKYDKWNYDTSNDPSKESVLRFLKDKFEGFVNDEKLKRELYWKLIDREILNEDVK